VRVVFAPAPVALIVSVYVCCFGVLLLVLIDSVKLAGGVAVDGSPLAVTPRGSGLNAKVTGELYPLIELTVTV